MISIVMLRDLLKEKNITLTELSKRTHISIASLSQMLNGKRRMHIATLNKICTVTDIDVADLVLRPTE